MRTIAFMLGGALASYTGWSRPAQAEDASVRPKVAACLAEPVVLKRFGLAGPVVVSLTDCEGHAHPEALPLISGLASPAARHDTGAAAEVEAPGDAVEPLNAELLIRLQQLATRFPDRPIEIVSGYRTRGRASSRHRTGDALDLRVEGVDNEELSNFARTLEATGVGYYPNSTFVHVDVRASSAFWIDRSGPGERADYVHERATEDSAAPAVAAIGAETEQDAIAAQAQRRLTDASNEVHGPELPVADEDAPTERRTDAEGALRDQALKLPPTPASESAHDERAPDESLAETKAPVEHAMPGASEEDLDPAQLEADLKNLAERALIVMRQVDAAG
jgi:hypothetical protein